MVFPEKWDQREKRQLGGRFCIVLARLSLIWSHRKMKGWMEIRVFLPGFGKAFSRGDLVPQESEGMDGDSGVFA